MTKLSKNSGVKLYKGHAYDLSRVLDTGEKYEAYILECGRSSGGTFADLGRKRYLYLSGIPYLVLISDRSVKIKKLKANEDTIHEGLAVIGIKAAIEQHGIKCRTVADYRKMTFSFGTAWKRSLDESSAVISKYGYAMQCYFWCDCDVYEFKIRFVKRGHIRLDGQNIMSIRSFHGSEDIMKMAGEYIELALTAPVDTSVSVFEDKMNLIGLKDQLGSVYFNLPNELM